MRILCAVAGISLCLNHRILMAQQFKSPAGVCTEITIRSTKEEAWRALTDFNQYSEWHPFISSIRGKLKKGKYLKVYLKPGDEPQHFKAKVLEIIPPDTLVWGGSLPLLFSAKHFFYLSQVSMEEVKLVQGEVWKGWLGKRFGRKVYEKTFDRFREMNQALKMRLENQPR